MRTAVRSIGARASLILLILTLAGCDGGLTDPEPETESVVLVWGEAALESVRETVHGPPMTGRTLAIVHTAMYDAWAAYDEVAVGTRLGGTLRRPAQERTLENKEAAISYAAFRTLVDLFPGRASIFESLLVSQGYDPDDMSTDPASPAGIGNLAAAALIEFRRDDGSNQLNGYADLTGYTPVNDPFDPSEPGIPGLFDPFRWQPLIHNGKVQQWIIPHWRDVIPFALTSADQFMPPPPAPVDSEEYRQQAEEVIQMQANLTDRQKVIAEFWADGPDSEFPPGHWCTIAQFASKAHGFTVDEDVKLFFLVANAVFDASIGAWAAKIHYDYVRPVSAIRFLKEGQEILAWAGPGEGTQLIAGEAWVPYQVPTFRTPPFAEYVSGHSTFSAAGAEVVRRFLGTDEYGQCMTFPAGWSRVEPGLAPEEEVELCWDTFSSAAEEAGISRLYGGIHFRQGNEEGLALGRRIGEQVWQKAQTYFNGSAARIVASR